MRKAVRVTAAVAFAVLLLAALAPAAVQAEPAGGGQGNTSFNLYGRIVALDASAQTIQVAVETPEYLLEDSPLTVTTSAATKFKQCDAEGNSFTITFAELETGRMVRIAGAEVGGTYYAIRVIQYVTD